MSFNAANEKEMESLHGTKMCQCRFLGNLFLVCACAEVLTFKKGPGASGVSEGRE